MTLQTFFGSVILQELCLLCLYNVVPFTLLTISLVLLANHFKVFVGEKNVSMVFSIICFTNRYDNIMFRKSKFTDFLMIIKEILKSGRFCLEYKKFPLQMNHWQRPLLSFACEMSKGKELANTK